jgi:hypothetical protein
MSTRSTARVTFNPVVTTGSGSTTQLLPAHGSDSDDPFVASGNSGAAGQTAGSLFSLDNQVCCTFPLLFDK